MKLLIFLFLLLTNTLFAEIKWISYEKVFEKAQEENKLVMVMISQEGCDACWFMNEIIFKNKDVTQEMTKGFVSAYFDLAEDFAPEELEYFGTPTIYFLDAKGEQIDHFVGARNVKDFTEFIHKVKAKVKN